MTNKNIVIIILLFSILLFTFNNTLTAIAETPTVKAVLFYSPTCPHCHKVITEDLPPLFDKYGDQLIVIGIDVTTEAGQALYQAAIKRFEIPEERLGVPTLIVGETVLVGDLEIPEMFPLIIENGLKSGGIDWPDIPGLKDAVASIEDTSNENKENPTSSTEQANSTQGNITQPATSENLTFTQKLTNRFSQDLSGNIFAIVTLLIMIAVAGLIIYYYVSGSPTAIFNLPSWVIPVTAIVGIIIAFYLSYVEITQTEAVCGPVGDCNTVQQSSYAYLFGVIPIGVLGIAGYIAFLAAWMLREFVAPKYRGIISYIIWAMAWFGVLFSIYLTFLEPFVIGATCIWCIGSAYAMTIILWASTGPILNASKQDVTSI